MLGVDRRLSLTLPNINSPVASSLRSSWYSSYYILSYLYLSPLRRMEYMLEMEIYLEVMYEEGFINSKDPIITTLIEEVVDG